MFHLGRLEQEARDGVLEEEVRDRREARQARRGGGGGGGGSSLASPLAALLDAHPHRWAQLSKGADGFGEARRSVILREVWCLEELGQLGGATARLLAHLEHKAAAQSVEALLHDTPVCVGPGACPDAGAGRKFGLELKRIDRAATAAGGEGGGGSRGRRRGATRSQLERLLKASTTVLHAAPQLSPGLVVRLEALLRQPQPVADRAGEAGGRTSLAEQLEGLLAAVP